MRVSKVLAILALYVLAVILAGGLLAPLVWLGLESLRQHGMDAAWLAKADFRRVAHRSFMIMALVGLWPMLRALRLRERADWGYGIAPRRGLRDVAIGLVFGLCTMGFLVASLQILGVRVWTPGVGVSAVLSLLLSGVLAGLLISLIEETLFRGAIFTAVRRGANPAVAVVGTALAYAAVHFIKGDPQIPVVHWYSGFTVLAGSFDNFAHIDNVAPFIALTTVGIFLACIRQYAGHVTWGIGIHAGWVAMIRIGGKTSDYVPDHPLAWLAPASYDRITGPLAALYLIIWTIMLVLWQRRRQPHCSAVTSTANPSTP